MSILPRITRTCLSRWTNRTMRGLTLENPRVFLGLRVSPQIISIPSAQGYAKAAKGGGGTGGKKGKKSLGDLLDDMDSDSDDEIDKSEVNTKPKVPIDEDDFLGGTPAAKFIQSFSKSHHGKGGKKDGKAGKVKSKGDHLTTVSFHEAKALIDVDIFWKELEGICNEQKEFFINNLTLRSATALDDLPIEFEGDIFPLRELADISKKDPKRLIIDTSAFPQSTVNIMAVLRSNSGLNLNPQQEGTRIYVPIPKVTREHREKLSKAAKQKCNETKDKLRKLQSKKLSQLGEIELSGKIHAPKNNFLAVHDIMVAMTDHFAMEADTMAHKKQKDLMETS